MTRRERGRRLVPFAAALTVVGVVVLSFSTSGHRPALAAPPLMPQRPLDAMSAPACPLPVGQQIKSVKAFGKMLPTFRHPRCINCHGGLDIKSKRHPGYEHARAFPKDPRKDLLTMPERADLHANCDVCHTNIKGELTRLDGTKLTGWLVAPMPMNFVDRTGKKKSDKEMCLQMKRFEPTGTQFVDHLKTDHGEIKFIEAAFNGDRALDSANLVDHKIRIQKPPGSQASLIELAQTWVKEVGDGYTASPECGCVVPNIKLQVHHRSAIDPTHVTHRAGWVGFSGDANFEVSMAAVHEAQGRIYYTGEKSLVRSLQPYFADKRCQERPRNRRSGCGSPRWTRRRRG